MKEKRESIKGFIATNFEVKNVRLDGFVLSFTAMRIDERYDTRRVFEIDLQFSFYDLRMLVRSLWNVLEKRHRLVKDELAEGESLKTELTKEIPF